MKLIMDIKEERESGAPCLWNDVIFALNLAINNDIAVQFSNCEMDDLAYLLPLINETTEIGTVRIDASGLFYEPLSHSLRLDFGKVKEDD